MTSLVRRQATGSQFPRRAAEARAKRPAEMAGVVKAAAERNVGDGLVVECRVAEIAARLVQASGPNPRIQRTWLVGK